MTSKDSRSAITTTGLRKSFGDHVVLDGLDLDVRQGTVFALLGANGAGKTTTVKILSTLIRADAGAAAGRRARRRPRTGCRARRDRCDRSVLGGGQPAHRRGKPAADGRSAPSRPRTNRRRRTAQLLEQFDLVDAGKKPASTYSGGMRRRLDLAMTLVGDPQVIFLDEPTTGLDPRGRRDMWQIVRDLVADGVTIFLTTQYLDEADELADRIAVLDRGRVVAEGTAEELKRRIPGGHVRLHFADPQSLDAAMRVLGLVVARRRRPRPAGAQRRQPALAEEP